MSFLPLQATLQPIVLVVMPPAVTDFSRSLDRDTLHSHRASLP